MFRDFLKIAAGFVGALIVTLVLVAVYAPGTLTLTFGG